MRVRLLRRRVVAGLALGLSVLVGFATPLGDAALATPAAFAAAKSSTEGTSNAPGSSESAGSAAEAPGGSVPDGGSEEAAGAGSEPGASAEPEAEGADTSGESATGSNTPAPDSDALHEALGLEAADEAQAFGDISPLSAGDPTTCAYANAGAGGQYKDTLCWFDLSYMNGATKTSISTEWVEYYITPNSEMIYPGTCTRQGTSNWWDPYSVTCTATSTWGSTMGVAYGQNTQTRTATGATSTNATTALANGRSAAVTAARNAARTGLYSTTHPSGNVTRYFGNVTNYPIEVQLPNSDYTFSAELDITAPASTAARMVSTVKFPTWSGAFLGNNGFYQFPTTTDVRPAIYQNSASANSTTTTSTLKNIKMFQGGTQVSGYSVVVADAESTDQGESIAFTTSGGQGFRWLPNNPAAFNAATDNTDRRNAAVGRACNGTDVGQFPDLIPPNPNSVTCTGGQAPATTERPAGGAMLQALAPTNTSASWSVSQAMTGNGLQGIAFGVLMARASLTVNVADRVIDSTGSPTTSNFQATVTPSGLSAKTASTGSSGTTGSVSPSFPVLATGTQLNYANVPTTFDSSYTQAWQCTKTGGTTTEYWPVAGSPTQTSENPPSQNNSWFNLLPGYHIACNVTYTPPYVTLVKDVQQNGTDAANVAADWALTMAGVGTFAPTTSNSTAQGTAPLATGVKRPIAINSTNTADVYNLTEAGPSTNPPNWQFGYDWTGLSCVANQGSTTLPAGAVTETKNAQGQVTASTLKVAKGNDLTCTYTNTANKPELKVKKEAFAAPGNTPDNLLPWGTSVSPSSDVFYRLTFDNTLGSAPMNVNYDDYLGDVLDDANYNVSSIRIANGTELGYPASSMSSPGITVTDTGVPQNYDPIFHPTPKMNITGFVPARQTRTVWFTVSTFANDLNASTRTEGYTRSTNDTSQPNRVGYSLNNYLVESGHAVPAACAMHATGADPSCTHHPMRAWTIKKESQPQDGAMIHSGGNIYYRVKVTNFSDGDLTGVQLNDNMTQTLAATVIDLGAQPAVTVPFGLSYYRADGSFISGTPWTGVNSGANPTVVFTANGAVKPDGATCNLASEFVGSSAAVPAAAAGCWTFTTPTFNVPKQIGTDTVAYAIVGYAVKGGSAAQAATPGATNAGTVPNADTPIAPSAIWVNTVQAGTAQLGGSATYPSSCNSNANGGTGVPPGWINNEEFFNVWASCKVYHSIGESYFHIWKKDGSNVPGTQVNNNLQNATFVLADTQTDAENGRASRWLCRVDNAPTSTDPLANLDWVPTGNQIVGAQDPANGNPGAAWGKSSAGPGGVNWWLNQTNAARELWNLQYPTLPQKVILPVCGAFFHLDSLDAGQAAGSWRALDVRGGDTVDGTASGAPLPNWRTASALNVAGDSSKGRHGTYWLVETVAPQNFQLLSQPMQMWVAPSSPAPGGIGPGTVSWYNYQGRLSLPLVGVNESATGATPMPGGPTSDGISLRPMCVNPWQLPANNQPSCVMPTGWTMPVFDVKMAALPLTGGAGPWVLGLGGAALLTAMLAGVWWWRRRSAHSVETRGGEHRH